MPCCFQLFKKPKPPTKNKVKFGKGFKISASDLVGMDVAAINKDASKKQDSYNNESAFKKPENYPNIQSTTQASATNSSSPYSPKFYGTNRLWDDLMEEAGVADHSYNWVSKQYDELTRQCSTPKFDYEKWKMETSEPGTWWPYPRDLDFA